MVNDDFDEGGTISTRSWVQVPGTFHIIDNIQKRLLAVLPCWVEVKPWVESMCIVSTGSTIARRSSTIAWSATKPHGGHSSPAGLLFSLEGDAGACSCRLWSGSSFAGT